MSLFLTDPHNPDALVLRSLAGVRARLEVGYTQSIYRGVVGAAARGREAVYAGRVKDDPRYVPLPDLDLGDAHSEVATPLLLGGRLLGVLNVEAATTISRDDVPGLQIIADQLGVALENARLFSQTETALGEMELLYQTSQRISGALDVKGVVRAYLEQVALQQRYGCTVFVSTHNETGAREEIVLLGRWWPETGMTQPSSRHAYFGDSFDPLLDAGQTVTITDTETDPRVSETLRDSQRKGRRPALALIPLMVRGKRIGGVSLSHPKSHSWSEADLRPYQVTAAQAYFGKDPLELSATGAGLGAGAATRGAGRTATPRT